MDNVKNKTAGAKVPRNKTRSAAQDVYMATNIDNHQRELHAKVQFEGLVRFSESSGATGDKGVEAWRCFQSYKGEAALPPPSGEPPSTPASELSSLLTAVAQPVPFHSNAIKNVSKIEEAEFTLLRVNFQTPGQLVGRKEDISNY
uniref:FACT complex subunit n=1 Tax=Ganoderma boninense TaxID=34458 RepID=A0A5K1K3P7_9APHY|nr:N/A [Ganoderma boninense]